MWKENGMTISSSEMTMGQRYRARHRRAVYAVGEKFTRREALAGRAFCFLVSSCGNLIVSQSSA